MGSNWIKSPYFIGCSPRPLSIQSSCGSILIHYEEIPYGISPVFSVVWRRIDHVLGFDGAAPRGHHSSVPREALQKSQRILPERHVKENLDVVEQNHVGSGCHHDLCEQTWQLQYPLALCQLEHPPRQLEIDVDQWSLRALVNILERRSFAGARRSHQDHKTVVQRRRL